MANIPILLHGTRPDSSEPPAAWQSSRLAYRVVRTVDDLVAETALLLHRRDDGQVPRPRQRMNLALPDVDPVLVGNRVLVVDDDVRNIFALTSMLERHGAVVLHAENGRRAIEVLRDGGQVDAILMDIMMPEMDGYQTTREIRKLERFSRLPIIALTAKAMKGDRDRCLEAGCSDYIAKPVEVDQLLGLLRGWLVRQPDPVAPGAPEL